MGRQGETFEILSVEDSAADTTLIRELMRQSRVVPLPHVEFVQDGQEMLDFLRNRADADHLPDLVLLDLNLPRKDGREALREMRRDPRLRAIPVVVLTSSDRPEDVHGCYANAANAYVTKPGDLEGFDAALRQIESFWLSFVKLPTRAG